MSDQNNHIIKKQVLDIHYQSRDTESKFSNGINEIYYSEIIPVLEKVCNEFSDSNKIIQLDKIEIDIGEISVKDIKNDFVQKVEYNFRRQLQNIINVPISEPPAKSRVKKIDISVSNIETIKYFLETGALPWWSSPLKHSGVEELFKELLEEPNEEFLQFIREGVKQKSFQKRLVYQFPKDIVLFVIEILSTDHAEDIRAISKEVILLLDKIKDLPAKLSAHSLILSHILGYLSKKQDKFMQIDLIVFLLQNLAVDFNISFEKIINLCQHAIKNLLQTGKKFSSFLPGVLDDLQKHTQDIIEEKKSTQDDYLRQQEDLITEAIQSANELNKKQDSHDKLHKSIPEDKENKPEDEKTPLSILKKLKEEIVDKDAEYYIKNAGVVILWPYLHKFFENLQLVDDNQFIDKEAAYKAIHLLQFLAAGEQNQPEYYLILNKLLCGLDISEPIPIKLKLTENDIALSNELLASVIKNWSALKNTSVKGFRESFLIREGKLSNENIKWTLKVQQKAYDMLLDKLPWSIYIVKLPWMKDILYVEW